MPERAFAFSRHHSALGTWEMADAAPHATLSGRVLRYTGYHENTAAPLRRRELPSGEITLIISFGDPLRLIKMPGSGASGPTVTSFAAGLHTGPALTEHHGHQHGIGIGLTPIGAHALFGVPPCLLTNSVVDLPGLLGHSAGRLVERLAGAPGWAARFALLDAALLARIAAGPVPAPGVAWAWRQLSATAGRARISELAAQVGWSHRHLVARFREQIGLAPKVFARVLRLQRSLALLERRDSSLADVSAAAGYYDQAHLNRDFRALAGCTPTALLASRLPGGAGIAG